MTVTEPTASTTPSAVEERPTVRTAKSALTADAMPNEKLPAALAIAVARSSGVRRTKVRPSRMLVRRLGRAGSVVLIRIRASAESANVTACTSTTLAAPRTVTSQPPSPGPAICPPARAVSMAELPASTVSRPMTVGR
ncbi:hypothetical protein EV186_102599 [Labedaea rhizosphaerae]|uniref:Uncharacterized protein n=1 Tax=Labedaea rhizosphaerae TaxID=598644 RepID=A0A4R6SGG2_LABRH|nr:hypothetical protein [Labedaea rhizosphaerae]TDQ00733.1 hypothetical protein EV186_102599 [Labedaea rhizosphaerae]